MQLYKYYSLLIYFSDSARNLLEHSVSILGFTFFTPISHKETDLWFLDYVFAQVSDGSIITSPPHK